MERDAPTKPEVGAGAGAEGDGRAATETGTGTGTGVGAAPLDARALEHVLPTFHFASGSPPSGALARWVTGLERPVIYDAGDGAPVAATGLSALGLTRGGLHEKALSNLRRAVPPGFSPGEEPAVLDDPTLSTILALPELVPVGHAWITYPVRGEGLFVMREDLSSTRAELLRLARDRDTEPVFERPVRVTRRGFEPFEWPSADRTTDPGFAAPDAAPDGGGER